MRINRLFHIGYCTNIHPGSNWERTFTSLKNYLPNIKKRVSQDRLFGFGLRLSNQASKELNENDRLPEFKTWLSENDLYIFTMNGFPYGDFHAGRVKDQVHAPDWTTPERFVYTKRLFEQLAELLPNGMSGGISTSPISYKHWHSTELKKQRALKLGAENIAKVVLLLIDIENRTGKYLHLDIEPEPDGLLENSEEVLDFFKTYLVPVATEILRKNKGFTKKEAEQIIKKYITICYDICHFSLAFEEPEDTFEKFANEGIRIGKIQVSAALKILYSEMEIDGIWDSLARFDESTYLHQVTQQLKDKVVTYNDLPTVLEKRMPFTELRAHFHVPIFLERFGRLFSTQDHILKVIAYLKENPVSEHLEIETYTWEVLPKELKRDLSESIVREISWLKERL